MNQMSDLGGGTIGGLLAARAQAAPDNLALIFEDRHFSYSELNHAADAVASGLAAVGMKPGDAVGFFMSNRPEFLFSFFGVARAGLVEVPINTAYKASFLDYALRQSGTRILITEAALAPALWTLEDWPDEVTIVVFVDGIPEEAAPPGVQFISWDDLLTSDDQGAEHPQVLPHDTADISFTSGTTGKSKGVVSPHLKFVVMARETATALGTAPGDRVYTCLPLFHGSAQITACLQAVYAGAAIVLSRKFSVRNFWKEVRDAEATEIIALGSMLHLLLTAAPTSEDAANKVQRVFAAPAPADILYRFEARFGVHIVEGYGSTETKNVLYNPLQGRKVGSLGKPTPTSILEIHGDDGNRLGPGEVGEIVYRPRTANIMFSAYHRDPESTLAGMKDLWWHTGDMGYVDDDGFFFFVDRKKDSLRRRGENISSQELESALTSFPGVVEAAAVAVPSDMGDDEVLAVITTSDDRLDFEALFKHCDKTMPRFVVPRYFRIVRKLPKTPNGKVQKVILRQEGVTGDTWDSQAVGFAASRQI